MTRYKDSGPPSAFVRRQRRRIKHNPRWSIFGLGGTMRHESEMETRRSCGEPLLFLSAVHRRL
ncbi:unnamed protein product [Ectocarpus sp. 12 AP-2014]